jgi:hypothetical protein
MRTRLNATCATTNVLRSRRRADAPDDSSLSTDETSALDACSAGANPESSAAARATPQVNNTTRQSSESERCTGTGKAGSSDMSAIVIARPMATPAAAPIANKISVSVSHWRINRHRLAPMANRSAISRRRPEARASSSPATLAQAITSTVEAMAPSRIKTARRERHLVRHGCRRQQTKRLWMLIGRVLRSKRPFDTSEIGRSLLNGGIRVEPRSNDHPAGTTVPESRRRRSCDECHHAHRHPEIGSHNGRPLKSLGGHADDCHRISIQSDRLPDDGGVGLETAQPQPMTEDDDRGSRPAHRRHREETDVQRPAARQAP